MLQVTKFWVRSFHVDFLDVYWEIATVKGPTQDSDLKDHEIYNFDFFVLRSEAAMGPYEVMGGPFRDVYSFRDTRAPALHKWRQFFYKLRVVDRRTQEEREFGPAPSQEAPPDIIASAIIREEDVLFRGWIGRLCWLFPARTFGPRCSCYDPVLNRISRANHPPCFGTGWLGGYLSPVELFTQFDPSSKQVLFSAIPQQPVLTRARCSSFPPVSPQDILVEAENRRWRIVKCDATQRLRAIVHQELTLTEIPRSDIEYSIPLNVDARSLSPVDERNFKNAQTPDDVTDAQILTFFGHPRGTLR